jgi:hypothetical protein
MFLALSTTTFTSKGSGSDHDELDHLCANDSKPTVQALMTHGADHAKRRYVRRPVMPQRRTEQRQHSLTRQLEGLEMSYSSHLRNTLKTKD